MVATRLWEMKDVIAVQKRDLGAVAEQGRNLGS
jgi:hypothetical protein